MKEIWKDIEGYEGSYKVSNMGRVRSIPHETPYGIRGIDHILPQYGNGHGYMAVDLWKRNKSKRCYVHRLVASAFIPNPGNYPQVNHKNEDKSNNNVSNLEWCTCNYNNNYNNLRKRVRQIYRSNGNCRAIDLYTKDGKFLKTYESASDVIKDGFVRRAVYNVCTHKNRTHKGFVFCFHGEIPISGFQKPDKMPKKVYKFDSEKKLVNVYPSVAQAEKENGFSRNYLFSTSSMWTKSPLINGYYYSRQNYIM